MCKTENFFVKALLSKIIFILLLTLLNLWCKISLEIVGNTGNQKGSPQESGPDGESR